MRTYITDVKFGLLAFIQKEGIRFSTEIKGVGVHSALKLLKGYEEVKNVRISTILSAFFSHGYEAEIFIGHRGIETLIWKKGVIGKLDKKSIENSLELFRELLLKRLRENIEMCASETDKKNLTYYFARKNVPNDILCRSNPPSIDELLEALAQMTDCVSFFLRQPKRPNPVYYEYDPEDV